MKWFKNSFLLASLLLLFIWSSKNQSLFSDTVTTSLETVQSLESVKVVGTKLTIAEYQFQTVVKESPTSISFFLHYILEEQKTFLPSKFSTFLSRQDHNRCEKVSNLLFPFHFFW